MIWLHRRNIHMTTLLWNRIFCMLAFCACEREHIVVNKQSLSWAKLTSTELRLSALLLCALGCWARALADQCAWVFCTKLLLLQKVVDFVSTTLCVLRFNSRCDFAPLPRSQIAVRPLLHYGSFLEFLLSLQICIVYYNIVTNNVVKP